VERFWSRLAVVLGKRAGLVSVIGLLITLSLGAGISRLEFATGQDSYLNKDDQVYIDNVQYQSLFGGQAMLTVISMAPGHHVDELFTPQGRQQMQAFADSVHNGGGVLSVITPLTALDFSNRLVSSPSGDLTKSIAGGAQLSAVTEASAKGDTASAAARTQDSVTTLSRANAVPPDQRTLSNPAWVKFLLYDNHGHIRDALVPFFADTTHAQAITRLNGNESIDVEGKTATEIQKQSEAHLQFPNSSTVTTGASILLRDINNYLRGGMLTLGAIAVAIMIIILLVLFDVRWRLLPMGVILVGIVWAFGLAGYLGIPLTIVTIAGLPVMLGIGIDYAIQMHARIEEEVVIDRSEHPIQETARNLGPALLVVTFDAIFAFAALHFAKVPMIREFGLLLAVGIAAICVCSIITPLAVLGMREYRSPTKGKDFREGWLGRLVVRLGSLPWKWAPVLGVLSIGIFVAGIFAENKLVIQTDPVKWVNQNSQVIHDLNTIEDEIGGSSELGVFVKGHSSLFTQPDVDYVNGFEEHYAGDPRIVVGSSIVGTVRKLMDVPGANDAVPKAADVKAAWDVAPKDIQLATSADGNSALNIVYLTSKASLESQKALVDSMHAYVGDTPPPPGVKLTPSGLVVVGVGLLDNLEANRILLTYLALAFVGVFLAFRLRSVIRSLLSLVPVAIAVGLSSLVAWALHLTLSPVTAVGGPLVIAACTEFTSLILLRFVEERDRGLGPREAVDVAAGRTGRAFIVSALTAISGVAVLSFSSLPLLRDFGRVVGMNVTVALLSALVILPPLMVWADQDHRRWVSKGMTNRHTGKFIETGYEPAPEGV
jgi:hydrophobe/amphiphile efflux-3 (HAE3) family protein